MYFEDIKMIARYCPKLKDFQSCNLGVCTNSPFVMDNCYSNWGYWSQCDATCGEGKKQRSRVDLSTISNQGWVSSTPFGLPFHLPV